MQKTDLTAVRQSVSLAKGLPNAQYIDPTVYEEEKHALHLINGRDFLWLQMSRRQVMRSC